MQHCIISQFKNECKRLEEWIMYHFCQGIDSFILFDDFSQDDSRSILNRIQQKIPISIQIFNTDENCGIDYNRYIKRQARSISKGLQIASHVNSECICYIIDVDEFLNGNDLSKTISEITSDLFSSMAQSHIYVQSFDVRDDFSLEKSLLNQESSKWRWDEIERSKTIYKDRGKSVIKASKLHEIPQKGGYIHYLITDDGKNFPVNNKIHSDILRIHHYRQNSGIRSFPKFDDTLYNRKLNENR